MYSYNRNMYQPMYYRNNNDRFLGAGIAAPLILGGIAGYALGNNKQPYYYPYPYSYPVYYNNYYYPYY